MFVVAALLLFCLVSGQGAGWNEPNIVCCQHPKNGKGGDVWKAVDHSHDAKPPPIYDSKHLKPDSTILVLVAALRESLLAQTLQSFFANATNPDRVHFAIVQQNANSDKDIIEDYCEKIGKPVKIIKPDEDTHTFKYSNPNNCEFVDTNVRVLRLSDTEAKGPAYARGRGNELVQDGDDFCMQIDAHTIVGKDWDTLLMAQWASVNNEFAIISTYPPEPESLMTNSNGHWEMPHLCCAEPSRGEKGVYHNCQAKAAANMDKPMLAPLWAAGLSFSKCHAERLVPNDVGLKQIFTGEEYSRAARFWTHGYDFYSMDRPVVSTLYGDRKGGKGGWHSDGQEYQDSVSRLQTMFGINGSDQSPEAIEKLGIHTLGHRRTLQQYIAFSGIDPLKHTAVPNPGLCDVHYVPWDDSKLRARVQIGHGRVEDGDWDGEETVEEVPMKDEVEEARPTAKSTRKPKPNPKLKPRPKSRGYEPDEGGVITAMLVIVLLVAFLYIGFRRSISAQYYWSSARLSPFFGNKSDKHV